MSAARAARPRERDLGRARRTKIWHRVFNEQARQTLWGWRTSPGMRVRTSELGGSRRRSMGIEQVLAAGSGWRIRTSVAGTKAQCPSARRPRNGVWGAARAGSPKDGRVSLPNMVGREGVAPSSLGLKARCFAVEPTSLARDLVRPFGPARGAHGGTSAAKRTNDPLGGAQNAPQQSCLNCRNHFCLIVQLFSFTKSQCFAKLWVTVWGETMLRSGGLSARLRGGPRGPRGGQHVRACRVPAGALGVTAASLGRRGHQRPCRSAGLLLESPKCSEGRRGGPWATFERARELWCTKYSP